MFIFSTAISASWEVELKTITERCTLAIAASLRLQNKYEQLLWGNKALGMKWAQEGFRLLMDRCGALVVSDAEFDAIEKKLVDVCSFPNPEIRERDMNVLASEILSLDRPLAAE